MYVSHGDDPFIYTGKGDVPFSAWTYAKERAEAICKRRKR
jgi:hypothetical protein